MEIPLRLLLIYGSVRPNRLCDTVARWAEAEVARDPAFTLEVLDPRPAWPEIDAEGLRASLAAADAALIVAPEYNHSFPGPLKALIDSVSEEWAAKPVAFVSYGAASGGLRAVEHLRAVFAELHAVAIRDGVAFHNVWESFRTDGRPADEFRPARAIRKMLAQLAWWGRALRAARETQAYGEAA